MVDHIKAWGRKLTFLKLALMGYTVLFFLWYLPFQEVQWVKLIPFENLFGGSWFAIIGIAFIVEGFASLPEMKRGGSKFGAYIVIGLGGIALVLGSSVFVGGIDILMQSTEVNTITVLILGLAVALFFSMAYSELIHRKAFLHYLQSLIR